MRFANYAANKIEIISSTENRSLFFKIYLFGLNKKMSLKRKPALLTGFMSKMMLDFATTTGSTKEKKINKARRKLI